MSRNGAFGNRRRRNRCHQYIEGTLPLILAGFALTPIVLRHLLVQLCGTRDAEAGY
jgi:hypothetical protein